MYPELSLAKLSAMSQEREELHRELGRGAPTLRWPAAAAAGASTTAGLLPPPAVPPGQVLNAGHSIRKQKRETLVNLYLELNSGGSAYSMNCTFTEGTMGKPAAAE